MRNSSHFLIRTQKNSWALHQGVSCGLLDHRPCFLGLYGPLTSFLHPSPVLCWTEIRACQMIHRVTLRPSSNPISFTKLCITLEWNCFRFLSTDAHLLDLYSICFIFSDRQWIPQRELLLVHEMTQIYDFWMNEWILTPHSKDHFFSLYLQYFPQYRPTVDYT